MHLLFIPDDLIKYIANLLTFPDLLLFKITCKSFNLLVSNFSLIKSKLNQNNKYFNYLPYKMCINNECYDETWGIYEDIYHFGYHRYTHFHQYSLNTSEIKINKKNYKINTPYCCECFKKYVLIGDKENVKNNLILNEVDIEY